MPSAFLWLALFTQSPTAPAPSDLVWGDFDGDQRLDLLAIDAQGARLLHNASEGLFEDLTELLGLGSLGPIAAATWGDFDRDGDQDLFVAERDGRLRWLRNSGATFQDASIASGLAPALGVEGAHGLDFDSDGWLDLHLHASGGELVYRNLSGGVFEQVELELAASPASGFPPAADGELASVEPASERTLRVRDGRSQVVTQSPSGSFDELPTPSSSPQMVGTRCPQQIKDAATGNCLWASTTPTLGMLHPLSTAFNVDTSGRVGIGTTSQTARLHVVYGVAGDAVILPGLKLATTASAPNVIGGATSSTVSGGVTGAAIGGGELHNVVGSNGTIAGGYQNYAGQQAAVGGGAANSASSFRAFVGGGYGNSAQVGHATVCGGFDNDAIGSHGFIGGGESNEINNLATHATIGGGRANLAAANFATVAGGEDNQVLAAYGTIGGGGAYTALTTPGNRVHDEYGTIAGGAGNAVGISDGDPTNQNLATIAGGYRNAATGAGAAIGGGAFNVASDLWATAAGGGYNTASGWESTVSGGEDNTASDVLSTVSGGYSNTAGGSYSAVAGGSSNTATGAYSTVSGGRMNSAAGNYSHASGRQAKANHEGASVWADATIADFASTANNQFLIRAGGGVGINTNAPAVALHVAGGTDAQPTGGGYVQSGPTAGANIAIDDNEIMARSNGATSALFLQQDGGNLIVGGNSGGTVQVAIGTNSPSTFMLAVNGTAAKPGGGSWSVFSDARLKQDVEDLDGALDDLLALRGRTFDYADREHFSFVEGEQRGFIAQEVERVFPEWVSEDEQGYKSLSITGFEALTVEALRELRTEKDAEVAALRAELAEQRSRHATLQAELFELRELVRALIAERTLADRR